MIIYSKGQVSKLDHYINNLCKIILRDEEIVKNNYLVLKYSISNFSISSKEHLKIIEVLIKDIAVCKSIENCKNYIKSDQIGSKEQEEKLLFLILNSECSLKKDTNVMQEYFLKIKNKIVNEKTVVASENFEVDNISCNNKNDSHKKEINKLKEFVEIQKNDKNISNPFNDPLYPLDHSKFTPEISSKIVSIEDNELFKKCIQKTILSGIINNFLEKNNLIDFKLKIPSSKKSNINTIHLEKQEINNLYLKNKRFKN